MPIFINDEQDKIENFKVTTIITTKLKDILYNIIKIKSILEGNAILVQGLT